MICQKQAVILHATPSIKGRLTATIVLEIDDDKATNGKSKMKPADTDMYRKRLIELRDEIHHLSEATEEDRKTVELDQTMVGRLSRMDALQNQAMQIETERRRSVELQRIDSALQRIEDGDFGYCVSCGEAIEVKRLEYDPTVPTCVGCASTKS